jgi:hypothetical protein
MQNESCFWREFVQSKSIRGLADPVLKKTPLQDRVFGLYPGAQQQLAPRNHFTIWTRDHLGRDHIRSVPQFVESFWSACFIDPVVVFFKRPSYGFVLLWFVTILIHFWVVSFRKIVVSGLRSRDQRWRALRALKVPRLILVADAIEPNEWPKTKAARSLLHFAFVSRRRAMRVQTIRTDAQPLVQFKSFGSVC